jgi:alpha-tubulin suppressor-like RCC1 family protein
MTGKREGKNVLLVAGSNSAGQLGLGHLDDSHIWQTCPLNGCQNDNQSFPPIGSKVIQLSSGAAHTVAILEDDEKKRQNLGMWKWSRWSIRSNVLEIGR